MSESKTEKMYGWFSWESADTGNGTAIYRAKSGGEIEVTVVSRSPSRSGTKFGDITCLGEVGEYLRTGRPGMNRI